MSNTIPTEIIKARFDSWREMCIDEWRSDGYDGAKFSKGVAVGLGMVLGLDVVEVMDSIESEVYSRPSK